MMEQFLAAYLVAQGLATPTPTPATGAPPVSSPIRRKLPAVPVQITGDQFELLSKAGTASYVGNVKATRGDATLSCDRLTAFFTDQRDVSRAECTGHVEAVRGDVWAGGERADFDNVSGLIVISGEPKARKGPSHVEGNRFVIDVQHDVLRGEMVRTVAVDEAAKRSSTVPVEISADRFDVQGRRKLATWSGRVLVRRGRAILRCDRLTAFHGSDDRLRRAECVGHASAQDGDRSASGNRADFDVARQTVVLSGSPQAQQGPHAMTGSRFTLDLRAGLLHGENVRTRLAPDSLPSSPKEGR